MSLAKRQKVSSLLLATFEGAAGTVDPRIAVVAGKVSNLVGPSLDDRLDGYITTLQNLQEMQSAARRARLDDECAADLGVPAKKKTRKEDDDEDGSAKKEVARSILETPKEADKRTLSKRLLEVVGGRENGHLLAPSLRAFLTNPNLPPMFSSRLTSLMNEDLFASSCFAAAKRGAVTKTDFEKLGEMMFAECMAKVFVLGEAYTKSVLEQFVWDEALLDTQLQEVTCQAVALALRDAQGISIKDGKTTDIFSIKTSSISAISAMKSSYEKTATLTAAATSAKVSPQQMDKPAWMSDPIKVKNSSVVCTTCQGLGHATCKGGSFRGWCSRCHGFGHKTQTCQSMKE
jgi:hypothetical protein